MVCAPLAQLDRVFDYESKGRGFESRGARQENRWKSEFPAVFLISPNDTSSIMFSIIRHGHFGFLSKGKVPSCNPVGHGLLLRYKPH